jgi:hypothetical protein
LEADPYVADGTFSQDFNRYSYARNNPLVYTDPDGEFIHLIIGAAIGGTVNLIANWKKVDTFWQGLGYFGVGAVAGALGAGVGAGISSAMAVGGSFGAGFIGSSAAMTATSSFITGAAIGGGAGFTSGFATGLGNGLLGGQNFGQALWSGTKDGIIGGLSGAVLGGLAGGIDAVREGRRFWDGATVEKTTLAQQNIPIVGQRGDMNCGPASAESIDRSLGGNMTQEQIRNLPMLGGSPNTDPLNSYDVWRAYTSASGHSFTHNVPTNGDFANVLSTMQNGGRVAINLNAGSVGHSVVMQRVVQQTVTKVNGSVSQKILYYAMNPANGGSIHRISSNSIVNAYRIFYIFN